MLLINATTRRLEQFSNERTLPPYAILSHTWGDAEVTQQQYLSALASFQSHKTLTQGSPCFVKIDKSCLQACADGLAYVWIDACCIDRTSSAELSEAINCMYRWYQLARVCYVFLEDVEMPASGVCVRDPLLGPEDSLQEQLAHARWFTRGWTLQELLAPRHNHFYDKNWQCLGTKETLQPVLASITGIDAAYLAGEDLREASVAKRMSWAARRVTTKVEDVAYCLIGIFDVNMPLLYGEGKKAFVRLQEEIFRETDDLSLFAWQPKGVIVSTPPQDLDTVSPKDGISIFAQHPSEFASTADLSPYASTGESNVLSGGKGLKMELPLFNIKGSQPGGLRVAALCCESSSRRTVCPGLIVQELTPGHYMRHPWAGLVQLASCEVEEGDARRMFIRKTMSLVVPKRACSQVLYEREMAVTWY
ncbi:hypothetical protein OPT61_g9427 [Boeremia exigua]|uniref:Uncharacterized protein n=1 Tax=Boeremia exigua TaxID=749465 RepID=A0ACC2HU55_9PLEO|nr:hypothetical protein OPT61_g9427 [Boeremia exigua]